MKKVALFVALFTMMTFSAKAQWLNFSENQNRAVVGFHAGLVGYNGVDDIPNKSLSDLGFGISLNIVGVYADFLYVTPDHMYDSHVVYENWDDHDAFVINVGYQIPIYKDYVFITPLIGWSRVSTGITEGNNIGVDPENRSIFHKYHSTWHRNDFNYGGVLTVAPCKYFEINAAFTAHAAYAGIAFNLANFK
jgi:hypothetical protein